MNGKLRERLISSCFQFLVPVARFLLNAGVSYKEFEELAKRAFVVVASSDYGIRGRDTSLARVSIMTGLGRKEVSRMRQQAEIPIEDTRRVLSPLADLISTWCSDSEWMDADGHPKELPFRGSKSSFSSLVAEKVGDRPVGAVQRELERLGAVDFSDSSNVRLLRPHLIPNAGDERLISALSYSLRALAETVAHNCAEDRPANSIRTERFIESEDLSPNEVEIVRAKIVGRLSQVSEEVDGLLSSCRGSGSGPTKRIGVGFYYSE